MNSSTEELPLGQSRKLRGRPRQARSQETFDRILSAAAELLDDVGWDGFNTNALAKRSGCRVSAIYRYFPDKQAIVLTLAEAMVAEWGRALADFDQALEATGDVRIIWKRYLSRFVRSVAQQPGALAIRKAMQSSYELRAIDQADNERMASMLGDLLSRHISGLTAARARVAARVLIESAVVVIDLASEQSTSDAKRLLRELEAMHLAYFDQLGAPEKTAARRGTGHA